MAPSATSTDFSASRFRNGCSIITPSPVPRLYRRGRALECSAAPNYGSQGAEKNLQIKHDRVILHVVQVYLRVQMHGALRAAVDLPPTSHTRGNIEALSLPRFVGLDHCRKLRPGTNQAHFSYQNVP